MNSFYSRFRISIFFFLVLFISSGCFPSKKMTVASVGSLIEDVAKASSRQSDLRLIREGMPAYLLLMDGMVEAWPGNDRLLIAAAQGYSSYASLLGDQEKEYARDLYGKARKYALKSLEARGLKRPVETPFDDFKEGLKQLGKKDVPFIFWTAACWASWISLNLESMEALAELPRVEWMMRRVLELDETFYYGGSHLFMGIWFASRPKGFGGDLKTAQQHFLKALELGEGKFLMAYVYYANDYARKAMDQDLFRSLLQKVQGTPADISPDLTLLNTVAKKKAEELMTHMDEYFE
jgi:TRAP transporter T-component